MVNSLAMNPGVKRIVSDDLVERLARTEEALGEREMSLQLIVDSTPVPVAVPTPSGEVEAVNQPGGRSTSWWRFVWGDESTAEA